jgi:hypothetical protein
MRRIVHHPVVRYSNFSTAYCPLNHRYTPKLISSSPVHKAENPIYVIGGAYGNRYALEAIFRMADMEQCGPPLMIFNGDFNFFNSKSVKEFEEVNEMVMRSGALATQGNVEMAICDYVSTSYGNDGKSSLVAVEDIDCGCAYPSYVSSEFIQVTYSNPLQYIYAP